MTASSGIETVKNVEALLKFYQLDDITGMNQTPRNVEIQLK